MIKKVFVGVLLAGVFVLLVFGAVNRTFAKTVDNEPLAINQNLSAESGSGNEHGNQNKEFDGRQNDCIADGEAYGPGAGAGNCDSDCDPDPALDGSGNGYRAGNNGMGASHSEQPGGGDGVGQANVEEWITYSGVVESVSSDVWVISLENDSRLELDGRMLRYLIEQGFTVDEGDTLTLTGFYDGDDFEVGKIENTTAGDILLVRDENGRPLWAGGRGGR